MNRRWERLNPLVWLPPLLVILLLVFLIFNAVAAYIAFTKPPAPVKAKPEKKPFWIRRP